jgi:hypothetical protein
LVDAEEMRSTELGRDLRAGQARTAGVRKALVALAVVTVAALTVVGAAGGDRTPARSIAPGPLIVRVPGGWHLLRGWLSDVIYPVPRLAVASFPARLSHQTCSCGFPNVLDFPRDGAFIFVWDYLHYPRRALARVPPRPVRFRLTPGGGARHTCNGPSDEFSFKDRGQVLQVEVYVGPAAGPVLRSQLAAALASLHVAANA